MFIKRYTYVYRFFLRRRALFYVIIKKPAEYDSKKAKEKQNERVYKL